MNQPSPVSARARRALARLVTFAAALLVACTGSGPPAGEDDQGVALRVATSAPCGAEYFDMHVVGDNGVDSHFTVELTALADAGDFTWDDPELDPTTGLEGQVFLGDQFEPLPTGTYAITVTAQPTPNDIVYLDPTWPEGQAAPNPRTATVTAGETVEKLWVFGCPGSSIGALDGTVIVDQGPDIVDFDYPDGKETPLCGTTEMVAQFHESTGDPYEVDWAVTSPSGVVDTHGPFTLPDGTGGETSSIAFLCEEAGRYDVTVTATDADQPELVTQFDTYGLCFQSSGEDLCQDPIASASRELADLATNPVTASTLDANDDVEYLVDALAEGREIRAARLIFPGAAFEEVEAGVQVDLVLADQAAEPVTLDGKEMARTGQARWGYRDGTSAVHDVFTPVSADGQYRITFLGEAGTYRMDPESNPTFYTARQGAASGDPIGQGVQFTALRVEDVGTGLFHGITSASNLTLWDHAAGRPTVTGRLDQRLTLSAGADYWQFLTCEPQSDWEALDATCAVEAYANIDPCTEVCP